MNVADLSSVREEEEERGKREGRGEKWLGREGGRKGRKEESQFRVFKKKHLPLSRATFPSKV
jgi:hypothetical protein